MTPMPNETTYADQNSSGGPVCIDEPVEIAPAAVAALAGVSPAHLEFVQHAVAHPEYLDRASFRALEEKDFRIRDPIQPWPTLVDDESNRKIGKATLDMAAVIKRIPSVIFDLDPESISEYYHLDLSFIRHFVLETVNEHTIPGAIGRGDFIKTADRLWCLEFNMGSNLGGLWEARAWEQRMLSVPAIADYLSRKNLRVKARNSLKLMMRHFIDSTKTFAAGSGQLNIAYALTKDELVAEDRAMASYFEEDFHVALEECNAGLKGRFLTCAFSEINTENGHVFLRGIPVHILVEFTGGDVPLHILRCQQRGNINIYNGPISYLLCNKLNFALLSEFQDAGVFTEEEQEVIQQHVPWTRRVQEIEADFHGVTVQLLEFIRENRKQLVLKKSLSRSGYDVVAGKSATLEQWEKAIAHALFEKDWIVQEYVECPAFPYQYGNYGQCPHDVIWGTFAFGETYGGAFLRMLPRNLNSIVNASRGSVDGIVLEVS